MVIKKSSNAARLRRHHRVRKTVKGSALKPRLNVFRSSNNIYAQIIDDDKGITLASASTKSPEFGKNPGGNAEAAKKIGLLVAEKAIAAGISTVVFDRGGYLYHGRVAALADGAREGGLKF